MEGGVLSVGLRHGHEEGFGGGVWDFGKVWKVREIGECGDLRRLGSKE